VGVLVDTTRCVGCRRCEKACNSINTDLPRRGDDFYRDEPVPGRPRRMTAAEYTVVNRFEGPGGPVHAKFQCMHCLEPACVSACLVGALTRDESGAVRYDAWKCMGCRYCMQACPFQVPAYEFGNALTPQVRKCTLCYGARLSQGQVPACVESCPMEVMSFGRRDALLSVARERLRDHPGRYVPRIYGEHEVGGTSWMYLSGIPFEDLGFPKLGYAPMPGYTEPIQHAIFKWFLPPAAVFAGLGGLWWSLARRRNSGERGSGPVSP
jgi:Fe-S-cluster-containing dehydrogenase component